MSSFKRFSEAHTAPTMADRRSNYQSKDDLVDKPKKSPVSDKPAAQPKKALAEQMERYGIIRVPVDYYHFGAFRYTCLNDAIAEAKRASHGLSLSSVLAGNLERGEGLQPGAA